MGPQVAAASVERRADGSRVATGPAYLKGDARLTPCCAERLACQVVHRSFGRCGFRPIWLLRDAEALLAGGARPPRPLLGVWAILKTLAVQASAAG